MSDSLWPPWTVAHQAPLSIKFFRQEYWNGLPFLSPEDLPDPEIETRSPAWQADCLPSEPPGKSHHSRLNRLKSICEINRFINDDISRTFSPPSTLLPSGLAGWVNVFQRCGLQNTVWCSRSALTCMEYIALLFLSGWILKFFSCCPSFRYLV